MCCCKVQRPSGPSATARSTSRRNWGWMWPRTQRRVFGVCQWRRFSASNCEAKRPHVQCFFCDAKRSFVSFHFLKFWYTHCWLRNSLMLSGLRVSASRVKEETHESKEESKASFQKASEGVLQETNSKDYWQFRFSSPFCNHNASHEHDVVTLLTFLGSHDGTKHVFNFKRY